MALFRWIFRHKISIIIVLLLLCIAGYVAYNKLFQNKTVVHYSVAPVARGMVISSVTGSGHVSASNQFDIKSTVSGNVIGVDAINGQHVDTGAVLVRLDDKDAAITVRDAQVNLQSAKLTLKKLKQPPDQLAVLQAENALTQSKDAKQKAQQDLDSARISLQKMTQPPDALALLQSQNALTSAQDALSKATDDLKKAREDGFNAVADAFLNFPTIMTGMNDMFYTSSIDRNQMNVDWYANQITRWESDKAVSYKSDLMSSYSLAHDAYSTNFDDYKASSRSSDPQTLEALILETYETSKHISDTVKAANNYIDLVQNLLKTYNYPIPSIIATHKNTLTTYTDQSNTSSSNLLSVKQTIENDKTAIVSAQRDINDKTASLQKLKTGADPLDIQAQQIVIKQKEDSIVAADRAISENTASIQKLKAGADPIDIQAQELAVVQRQNALTDAQDKLKNYIIRAPFSGVIAAVPVKLDDSVSSSTVIATIITSQSVAELSLSEVDVAKVKRTQKVTLTFDAIPDISISGVVSDIDTVGTVSQGVVTYNVKIAFDTQDDRVRPEMSVNGAIITDIRENVLVVPNSAVKTRGNTSYVDAPSESISAGQSNLNNIELQSPLKEIPITIGLTNDTLSEVVSGLNEGDMIIIKTIQQQAQSTQTQAAPSLFGSTGGNRGGLGGGATGGAARRLGQ